MPFLVDDLLEGRTKPVTIRKDESARKALVRMGENDFSQLPVVDEKNKPIGLITYESILKAINVFNTNVDSLLVTDAVTRVETFHQEDDLFDLLNRLKETNAVVIVGNDDTVTGIVTSYDTNEYFRRRSEDIMLLEDIESTIKETILAIHPEESLEKSIREISNSSENLKRQFQNALMRYMNTLGDRGFAIDQNILDESFKAFDYKEQKVAFDQLTLNDYIMLFTEKWDTFQRKFRLAMDVNTARTLLEDVRNSRNQLVHYRGELNTEQRERIRFCADWLSRYQLIPIEGSLSVVLGDVTATATATISSANGVSEQHLELIPSDEAQDLSESRYARLAQFLHSLPGKERSLKLSLEQIEIIVQNELPPSAYSHRSWWANDSVGHVQSKQWLEVGWRVSSVNLNNSEVTFTRVAERERAYINFFNQVIMGLREDRGFPLRQVTPDGSSWIIVTTIPVGGASLAGFGFSFSRNHQLRIELYIDAYDQKRNKEIFDILFANKDYFEQLTTESISWERIDDKRACRIALYKQGSITDSKSELDNLCAWAVAQMPVFYEAFAELTTKAIIETKI